MAKKPKRPTDANQLAHFVIQTATGQMEVSDNENSDKNLAAVELGRLGGLKGGKARAKKLSAQERSKIAKQAALSRWRKEKND